MCLDRRSLLRAAGSTLIVPSAASGHALGAGARPDPSSGSPPPTAGAVPVTAILAHFAVTADPGRAPEAVRHQATRTLLNWVGCAIGGSGQDAPRRAHDAIRPFAGPEQANLFGRRERLDAPHAALVNAIASHVLDFDDTDLRTIIHPAGPVASALTAFAQYRPVSGADFMSALMVGCEVECRIGLSVSPEHYAMGWHITGTTGVFGAAAATGRLLGLDERQMRWALGLAASQPVGLKVQFGTDAKSFHPGRAAQNGMLSALLARQGYTSAIDAIEGVDGWGQALSTRHDWSRITDGLGERWEMASNTFKPFACGIVAHPAIDAALRLRARTGVRPADIASVQLKVNPLVLELMGKRAPKTGLEGKFSVFHATAAALVTGQGGARAFTDAAVADRAVAALRQRVGATPDAAIGRDQADLVVTTNDGRTLHEFVAHAIGSRAHPMSDSDLADKFAGQARDILAGSQARELMALCWSAWSLDDAGRIGRGGAAI